MYLSPKLEKLRRTILFFALIGLLSCDETNTRTASRPIIMGDSATIVTETDSFYLQNMVMDVKAQPVEVPIQTEAVLVKSDSVTPQIANTESPSTASGFEIDFGTFKAVFTGIEAIEFRTQNPAKDDGVSYKVSKGDLIKSELIFTGVQSIAVSERYQSNLVLDAKGDVLKLDKLGTFTSDWKTVNMNKSNQQFSTSLSSLNQLSFKSVNNAAIKKAINDELRTKRGSQKTIEEWGRQVAKMKSEKDAPGKIILNNVQWKVTGKDSKGNSFTKLIRMDGL